jgi:flagellar assembly factor FliW
MNFEELGRIPIKDDSLLHFAGGLLGFESNQSFALVTVDDMKPFQWLIGMDEPGVSFMVIDPYLVVPDYSLTLDDETLTRVKAKSHDEIVVYAIATLQVGESGNVTVNLKAPVLINPAARTGAQIHLRDSRHDTRHPIGVGTEVRASA